MVFQQSKQQHKKKVPSMAGRVSESYICYKSRKETDYSIYISSIFYFLVVGLEDEDHFYTQPNEVNYQINSFKLTTK